MSWWLMSFWAGHAGEESGKELRYHHSPHLTLRPPSPQTTFMSAYVPPEWGGLPEEDPPAITMDVVKGGVDMGSLDLAQGRDHYTFGRQLVSKSRRFDADC
jgi:hypothetical protein